MDATRHSKSARSAGPPLCVLGSLTLRAGEHDVEFDRSARIRRVLAALVIHRGALVSADRLAEIAWGEDQPVDPRAATHNLISRLRTLLAGVQGVEVVTRSPGYVLLALPTAVDAVVFEDQVRAARLVADADPVQAATYLEDALALWHGSAYAEFADEDFARPEAARLDALHHQALEDRVSILLATGANGDAIGQLESMIVDEPLRERPREQLMIALYRSGRMADALASYRAYRTALDDELGLEPSEALGDLERRILQRDTSLLLSTERLPVLAVSDHAVRPDTTSPAPPVTNLLHAASRSSSIGRDNDLAATDELLLTRPVLTPIGVGGDGKTQQERLPPGVSAREAEVLLGVTEHMTNAEIGARLFISIRTVESHVSSLLRKLAVGDRRALAAFAADLRSTEAAPGRVDDASVRTATWSAPLASFVGRVQERAALAAALDAHRLVTAVGPGGVGKTRLAQIVAADVADHYADGVWYVDLVPVADGAMVASTLATALGLGEQHGRSAEDTVASWLGGRHALLVLDNCEHLTDGGVVVLLERLLAACPRLFVLATSRARLLVPYEWVFAVPGLSVVTGANGGGDAVDLFLARAMAAGASVTAADQATIANICRGLDGVALAIELAAARVPAFGLDGVEVGLGDRMQLLAGGRRVDDRHRSLRSTLDWSYALLDVAEQAVLRRLPVFATPFTAADAVAVIGHWPPLEGVVSASLATLADQSLLVAVPGRYMTRYRALETIRQYASERLAETGESGDAHGRHARWCLDAGATLRSDHGVGADVWRTGFDRIADELRGALGWASTRPQRREEAYQLAISLAELSYMRGMPGESQRRYEQAATLAGSEEDTAAALHLAAGAASTRHFGDDALRLHRAAANAALRAGNSASAARDLAQAAEFINRAMGQITRLPSADQVSALLTEAGQLSAGDPVAEARVSSAEACRGPDDDPATAALTAQTLALARRSGDVLVQSAALDQLTCVQLARGHVRAAAATASRRTKMLASLPIRADAGLEVSDALSMAADTAIAAGDLPAARNHAERVRDLPFYREEGQWINGHLVVVTALAGDWDNTMMYAERFREGWERAGRPQNGNLRRAAYAAGTVNGLRGDGEARTAWIDMAADLTAPHRAMRDIPCYEFFDAVLLLHQGLHHAALQRLAHTPETFRSWHDGLWRPWYAALWAEAGVLAGDPDATDRIRRARQTTVGNPIAAAIVDRAAAIASGRRHELLAAAAALDTAGCRYQWARTLIFAGGEERERGIAAMAAMGATAMNTETIG